MERRERSPIRTWTPPNAASSRATCAQATGLPPSRRPSKKEEVVLVILGSCLAPLTLPLLSHVLAADWSTV